jgi:hypothetical protein
MPPRLRSLRFASIFGTSLALAACATATPADPQAPSTATADADANERADGGAISGASISSELPVELVADLRLQGADADGRLLTLAPSFIATAECSDCGAPSYLRVLAVRCTDAHHCEVLTEQCEGTISREHDTYLVALTPVEDTGAEICAGYSGTFERP